MAGIFLFFLCVRKKGCLHLALSLFQFIPVFRYSFLFYIQTRSVSFKIPASNQEKHVGSIVLYGAYGLTFAFFYFLDAPSSMCGEGNGTPLQYSCLENPMDGGAWQAAVHGVAKSRTQVNDFTFTFHFHALEKEMATHSCSCLENPKDGGAWWAALYGVTQGRTQLK